MFPEDPVFTEGSSCVCLRAPAVAPSAALGQTQVLALVLRGEAVVVAATAAEPEARALVLLGVKEPHHGVVLAAALVLAQEAGVCRETHNPVTALIQRLLPPVVESLYAAIRRTTPRKVPELPYNHKKIPGHNFHFPV